MPNNAHRDGNRVPAIQGVSSVDGTTPTDIHVDPATNEMLVKASVSVTGSDGAIQDGVDGDIKATVFDLTNSNPLVTQIVDDNGDSITSFGGGTQYDEGDDISTTPKGTLGMVRDSSNNAEPMVQPLTDTQLRATAVPVSGTVTAELSATDNAVLDAIDSVLDQIKIDTEAIETSVQLIDNAISGNEMQVDVVASLPTGTNTLGAVEVDGTALGNGQVTVDTTTGGVSIISASAGRRGVIIKNQGSVACFVGTGTVSTSNGIELKPGESVGIETDSQVKAITASSSTTVGYLSLA